MEDISTQAFVLRTRAYGESDVIAVFLTLDYGKISGIAKGARRSKKRFAGGVLEIFQHVDVRFARRPHSSLTFLHECRLLTSHHAIAADVTAFAWASYLCELTDAMTREHDKCPELFHLFERCLTSIGSTSPEPFAHHYLLGLLDQCGWGPDFTACGLCGAEINEHTRPILDVRGSGIMCARHEADQRGMDPDDPAFAPTRRVINPELLAYVTATRDQPVTEAGHEVIADASLLFDRLVSLHVDKPLKSRRFLIDLMRAG